jgi:hypothetical protein
MSLGKLPLQGAKGMSCIRAEGFLLSSFFLACATQACPPQNPIQELTGVYTCDLSTHLVSEDSVRPMSTPRHTFGAATVSSRVYAVGHGRLGDESETVEFFDPGAAEAPREG